MRTRIISGAVLVVIMGGAIFAGGNILFALALIISLIGTMELLRIVGINNKLPGYVAYLGSLGFYALIYFDKTEYLIYLLAAMVIILMSVYVFMYPKIKADQISFVPLSLVYVTIPISYIYQLREMNDGIYIIWLAFICSWIADTCAYFTGMAIGKHKMAPVLSPKKSIEGAVGGIVGSAVIGMLYGLFAENKIDLSFNAAVVFALVGAVGAFISMIGDLAASAIKRNYEVKDYGTLIPGHGGILDRFDSLIFTAPIVYIVVALFA